MNFTWKEKPTSLSAGVKNIIFIGRKMAFATENSNRDLVRTVIGKSNFASQYGVGKRLRDFKYYF